MERLTTRIDDKVYYSKGKYAPTTLCVEMETSEIRECMQRLAAYEDTGLTPDEIVDFKIWLNEDREDLNDITIFNDLSELMKYRKTGVRPEEIFKLKQELENWKRESISDKAKLGEIRIVIEERKQGYLKRVPTYEEMEKNLRRTIESNESNHESVKIVDEHGREQLRQAIQKQNELLAKVEEIEAMQKEYFS